MSNHKSKALEKSVSEGNKRLLIPRSVKGESARQYNLRRQREVFGSNDEDDAKWQKFRNSIKGKALYKLDKLLGRNFYDRNK